MYSCEDLEHFSSLYQTETLPGGESIQFFIERNKLPYNIFQKRYRDTRNKIVEVKVDGMPEDQSSSGSIVCAQIVPYNSNVA